MEVDIHRFLFCCTINLKKAGPNIGVTDFSCYLRAVTKNVPLFFTLNFNSGILHDVHKHQCLISGKKVRLTQTNDEK